MLFKNYIEKNWYDAALFKVFFIAFIYFLKVFIDKYLEKTKLNLIGIIWYLSHKNSGISFFYGWKHWETITVKP